MSFLERIQSIAKPAGTLTEALTGRSTKSKESSAEDFDSYMRALLTPDGAGEVNEEELFAALSQERVLALKGAEAEAKYKEVFAQKLEELRRTDGKPRVEESARAALRHLVELNVLTAEEGNSVYTQAFNAAQLDDNKNVLYDSTGGANDPTRAVAKLEAALLAARTMMDDVKKGAVTETKRILVMDPSIASQIAPIEPGADGAVDGAEGFLWKPISHNQQRLAVLLPKEYTFNIEKVVIKDANGQEIEQGVFSSIGEGGPNAREKYNFSKKGGEYPNDVMVEMWTKDGQIVQWKIPESGRRYD